MVTSEQGTVTSLQSDVPPTVHTLPPDPVARGQWLCLEVVLRPDTRWLWLPPVPAVEWPDATEELRERAVGDNMERFLALRSTATTRGSGRAMLLGSLPMGRCVETTGAAGFTCARSRWRSGPPRRG